MKIIYLFLTVAFILCCNSEIKQTNQLIISDYYFLNNLEKNGIALSPVTRYWMKTWDGLNLEDENLYYFPEITGSTSINLKIVKKDAWEPSGYKNIGGFVPLNKSANPNALIAYFNLAALLGFDYLFRPTVKYELGSRAKNEFKKLITSAHIVGKIRRENKNDILKYINDHTNKNLDGCIQAKKEENITPVEDMINANGPDSGKINFNHPVIKFIQAGNIQPIKNHRIFITNDISGDALTMAREFSIILTLDIVFGQNDRFSGGNIIIRKDDQNETHFYSTDNGGAEIVESTIDALATTKIISRFDFQIINKLKELNNFLNNPSIGYLGYTDAKKFIVDLGLYYGYSTDRYLISLTDNLDILLSHVKKMELKYGKGAFFIDQ